MRTIAVLAAALVAGLLPAQAQDFAGKQVTMIIGSAPGGGTDTSGRVIAQFIANYLPGKPNLIVRNIPGAQGVTAMNYFVKQVAPDGLTITMGSTTQADPLFYRKSTAQFDPTKFHIIGGVGRGGTVLMIRKDAEPRLYDKKQPPVIMGSAACRAPACRPQPGASPSLTGTRSGSSAILAPTSSCSRLTAARST
jgi:tripartite-type tricarboxylate transporter receptor subunit TctC